MGEVCGSPLPAVARRRHVPTSDAARERLAVTLLRNSDLFRAPVDVRALAVHLGIQVIDRSDLPGKVAGILYRGPLRDVIVVNARHTSVRRRFTIAHEIGHSLFESRGVFFKGIHIAYASTDERRIDAFAGTLLMPGALVSSELSGYAAPARLAPRFGVSRIAMRRRLLELVSAHDGSDPRPVDAG